MQPPAVGLEVAAAGDAHRLDRGGPVEGLGDRRAPVDDERREVVVGDRDAADVEAARRVGLGGSDVGGQQVEAPEAERACRRCRGGEPAAGVGLGRLALEPGLVGAAPGDLGVALGHPLGRPAHDVEAGVGGVEVALLGRQLGVGVFGVVVVVGSVGHGRGTRRHGVGQQTMLRIRGTGQFTPSATAALVTPESGQSLLRAS